VRAFKKRIFPLCPSGRNLNDSQRTGFFLPLKLNNMRVVQSESPNSGVITLEVTNGLAVAVIQDTSHGFLMPTKDVALGYGVAGNTVRSTVERHPEDFKDGIHFLKGVAKSDTLTNAQPHQVFWTKAGIIRLGFFIKSERAKMFRDWAEQVILQVMAPSVDLPKVERRNHNRLTTSRLLEVMTEIALIDQKERRVNLMKLLLPEKYTEGIQLSLFAGGDTKPLPKS
jgi:hypothetical protein